MRRQDDGIKVIELDEKSRTMRCRDGDDPANLGHLLTASVDGVHSLLD